MADYIYLLENRLSPSQKSALNAVQQVARSKGVTLFLVGGAVRDLTSGSPVRDLDVAVQGNALKLKKDFELAGGVITGSADAAQSLFVRFPGNVRIEIGSTMSVTYPKPGKAVMKGATILDDLRRRDFTANAMALSLNEGSYGLLMDPLNGIADIENRELRLVSNYGFIEDPVRMIRAVRFAARLGWELEEKTKVRYQTGKDEGYIGTLDDFHRGYEAEEIIHEEDPLRVMRRLEAEGWMQSLAPGWTVAKANLPELEKVRDAQTQLQMQGIHPDASAVNFPLLTAKLEAKQVQALKKSFPRQGFVAEIDAQEGEAKELATALAGRSAAVPSAAYRMIAAAKPESLLYVLYSTKSTVLQARLKSFMTEWSQVRQKIPYALMQEMRITAETPGYSELVEKLFFELMDGKLGTVEELKAFIEPYSPPAPPPPVHVRRPRSTKKDAKGKSKARKDAAADIDDEEDSDAADLDADSEAEDSPRGAEEDEAAEDAAEDYNAVAELGGAAQEGKDDEQEEDEEEEDLPVAPRKAAPAQKPAPAAKAATPEKSPSQVEPPESKSTDKPPAATTKTGKASPAPKKPSTDDSAIAVKPSKSEPKSTVKKPVPAPPAPPSREPAKETRKPTVVAIPARNVPKAQPPAKATEKPAPAKTPSALAKKVAAKKSR